MPVVLAAVGLFCLVHWDPRMSHFIAFIFTSVVYSSPKYSYDFLYVLKMYFLLLASNLILGRLSNKQINALQQEFYVTYF